MLIFYCYHEGPLVLIMIDIKRLFVANASDHMQPSLGVADYDWYGLVLEVVF